MAGPWCWQLSHTSCLFGYPIDGRDPFLSRLLLLLTGVTDTLKREPGLRRPKCREPGSSPSVRFTGLFLRCVRA